MKWKVTTEPTGEPISLSEAKDQLLYGNDETEKDAEIIRLIRAARVWCENYTERAFMTQTVTAYLNSFPAGLIELPKPDLQAVTSIKYTDVDGAEQTVATSVYGVDTYRFPGAVYLKADQSWPTDEISENNAVEIVYTAGYGGAASVPEDIKQAMLLLLTHWHENRQAVVIGTIVTEVKLAVESLLAPYRVYGL